jgi:DUF1680 family protein
VYANPHLSHNNGKCAVVCGPLVYCLEEADNGPDLAALLIDPTQPLQLSADASSITAKGYRIAVESFAEQLYSTQLPVKTPEKLRFVPYYRWGNRAPGEMTVWVKYF